MPFDGSGNYTPAVAPNFPAVGGAVISATYYNAVINDIASGLSLCLTRDGQGKPSGPIDWNAQNLTNVGTFGATTGNITNIAATAITLGGVGVAVTVSPTFTGVPAAPTAANGTSTTQLATTAFVQNQLTANGYAPLASPVFTGNPTGPTPSPGDNDTSLATTAFVTAAILAALPAGVIMIWSGSSGAIPSGWLLCNGASGTPDLRDKFVVGAGSTYAVGATGGSANATLVSHSHTITITDPGHTHTANVTDPTHTHSLPGGTSSGGTIQTQLGVNSTASNGTSAAASTGITVANVSNTTGITAGSNTQGSSATNANLPPYYALCYIMKA